MAYTVFARKYRPQTFEELVGQEHVARTLSNAITQGRVAHAFLFTGVRGVGKTTTARLLAKCLNCESGPTPTPCNQCDACRDIAAGVDMDVQEIDGASNNSVEDVRRLQESLPFRPARDRFKVVIVDEVHMLSTGAFNAFLKTLEEPPPHVKFIFATTESHKVPVTIRSRCQRYDFRLIPQGEIANALRTVLAAEEVKADEATVAIVAREAAGSMRDALTLLDQLVAFGGDSLVGDEVAAQLGIAARASLHELLAAALEGRAEAVVRKVAEIMARGTDPTHFVRQLVELLRDLVVLRVVGIGTDLVDVVQEERDAAAAIVASQDPLELQRAFSAVAKLVDEVAKASSPWMVLEMGLVRVATRPPLRQVSELLARLEALEEGGGGGPSSPPRGVPRGPRRSGPPGRSSAAVSASSAASAEGRGQSHGQGHGRGQGAEPGPAAPSPGPRPTEERPPASAPRAEAGPRPERPAPRAEPPRPQEPRRAAPSQEPRQAAPPPREEPPRQAAPPREAAPGPSRSPEARSGGRPGALPRSEPPLRRAALQEWEALVDMLREGKPALAAVLEHGVPQVVSTEKIVLSFQEGSFYGRQANASAAREAILDAAARRLGARPALEIRFDAGTNGQERTVAAVEASRRKGRQEQRRREVMSHPVVQDAVQVFPEASGRVQVRLGEE